MKLTIQVFLNQKEVIIKIVNISQNIILVNI